MVNYFNNISTQDGYNEQQPHPYPPQFLTYYSILATTHTHKHHMLPPNLQDAIYWFSFVQLKLLAELNDDAPLKKKKRKRKKKGVSENVL